MDATRGRFGVSLILHFAFLSWSEVREKAGKKANQPVGKPAGEKTVRDSFNVLFIKPMEGLSSESLTSYSGARGKKKFAAGSSVKPFGFGGRFQSDKKKPGQDHYTLLR